MGGLAAGGEASQLARDGFTLVRDVFPRGHLAQLSTGWRSCREALRQPWARTLADHPGVRALAARCLEADDPHLVRALFFAKSTRRNWSVPWHQDRTVAVACRRPTPHFRGWTLKAGVPHAIAPPALLEGMVSLRIHLDSCQGPGALECLPGTHREILDAAGRARALESTAPRRVDAAGGDVLAMKPLLLHRSRSATRPRRVLHLEFAARPLPGELEWHRVATAPAPPGTPP